MSGADKQLHMPSVEPSVDIDKPWIAPDRKIHIVTGLLLLVVLLAVVLIWPTLVADAVQSFGTIGLFLTAYGVLFSIIEVLRTQSLTLAVGRAADRAARIAQAPYDMRDVSECATTIESTLHALQHDGVPRAQPLSRIVRLYTAIFQERYSDDQSPERIRVGIVQSHTKVGQRAKNMTNSSKP